MDQSVFQTLRIAVLFLPFLFTDTSACSSKNITCGEIKNTDGFKFPHFCHDGSELQVERNETQMAHADFRKNKFECSPEVVKMDNYSFTTKHCRELKVKCIIEGPNNRISETCVEIKVIENPQPQHSPGPEAGVAAAVVAVIIVTVIICWCYISWKKEQNNQQRTGGMSSKYLVPCSCFRSVFSLQTRSQRGSGFQEVRPADLESQPNNHIENGVALSGGDENDHSIQLENDCSGGAEAVNITRPAHDRIMNRNQRDDPGGTHKTKNRLDGEPAVSDQNAEDQDSIELPLLSDQRAAGEGFGVTGEADVLVNKAGFDPDQVKGHSRARDLGVQSTCKENLNKMGEPMSEVNSHRATVGISKEN